MNFFIRTKKIITLAICIILMSSSAKAAWYDDLLNAVTSNYKTIAVAIAGAVCGFMWWNTSKALEATKQKHRDENDDWMMRRMAAEEEGKEKGRQESKEQLEKEKKQYEAELNQQRIETKIENDTAKSAKRNLLKKPMISQSQQLPPIPKKPSMVQKRESNKKYLNNNRDYAQPNPLSTPSAIQISTEVATQTDPVQDNSFSRDQKIEQDQRDKKIMKQNVATQTEQAVGYIDKWHEKNLSQLTELHNQSNHKVADQYKQRITEANNALTKLQIKYNTLLTNYRIVQHQSEQHQNRLLVQQQSASLSGSPKHQQSNNLLERMPTSLPMSPYNKDVKQKDEKMKAEVINFTQLFQQTCENITNNIKQLKQTLKNSTLTVEEMAQNIKLLETWREEINSFPSEKDDFTQKYEANFSSTPNIKPKEAYQALERLNIPQKNENVRYINAQMIHDRLVELEVVETRKGDSKDAVRLKEIRQLKYIFRNKLTKATYDAYIAGHTIDKVKSSDIESMANVISTQKSELEQLKQKKEYENQEVDVWDLVDDISTKRNPNNLITSTIKIPHGKSSDEDNKNESENSAKSTNTKQTTSESLSSTLGSSASSMVYSPSATQSNNTHQTASSSSSSSSSNNNN